MTPAELADFLIVVRWPTVALVLGMSAIFVWACK